MLLREPVFSFTIPSIHDDTVLDCRIYHPPRFLYHESASQGQWRKKGAIIAHPYAPFGGCYDDPVVHTVAAEILKRGFVIGLFDFRGAGTSKGRTSWTAKPELSDYISFAGFFIQYLSELEPPVSACPMASTRSLSDRTLTPIQSSLAVLESPAASLQVTGMELILGGYSYGSLIAINLPSTRNIIERFTNAAKGTTESEIRLRAHYLSQQWNKEAERERKTYRDRTSRERDRTSHLFTSVAVGGEETEPRSRRHSRESRRSIDRVRRSFDEARRHLHHHIRNSDEEEHNGPDPTLQVMKLPTPNTYYLLISPLLPPISGLLTCFSNVGQVGGKHPQLDPNELDIAGEAKLISNPTMTIYGNRDVFVSHRKLRKWAEGLSNLPGSRFQYREVPGAGHFWHEEGVETIMRSILKDWVQDLAGEFSTVNVI